MTPSAHRQQCFSTGGTSSEKVACLQWRSPDQIPSLVQVDNILSPAKVVEDRNPPSTGVLEDSSDQLQVLPQPSLSTGPGKHTEQGAEDTGTRECTAIEILLNRDASQSIEVQLTQTKAAKKDDTRKGKCDVWNALSHCPFASDAGQ